MTELWAKSALLPDGWSRDVAVVIGTDGRITSVTSGTAPSSAASRHEILLPAPVNAHSHAFQRAMAGLTEARGPDPVDSFWTWRRLMFRFLDRLDPDQVQAITAFVQMEMLEAGYGASVEFHYLHHQPGGQPYCDIAEMSARVVAAAKQSGIGLTLLPVHYQFGGCDRRALGPGQIRFLTDPEGFSALHAKTGEALRALPRDSILGSAPHSLRAVGCDTLRDWAANFRTGPIHMHLAEQQSEVVEVQAAWGMRPIEWALAEMPLDPRWCLIHCTQSLSAEARELAATGVTVGLCPMTESSLGDGIFEAVRWLDAGGRIAIGSDSNIRVSLCEELRTLEYSQRLRDQSRAALATPERSTGRRLYDEALEGGARAAARDSGALRPGCWADLSSLDAGHEYLWFKTGDTSLDAWIFAGDDRLVRDVWSAGRHVVREGRHIERDTITAAYRLAISSLQEAL
ncbi:MAG: formimidoylglutamate deiminase [Pseudomonadota bacterium]